ncbi:hypothetical protein Poly41_26510 [Novipirellula artificiosorum]|uniref:Uncharacterized protein n=1 Tax=Novipirellula artificiosorum TaxID=2528016 RepID=A0A5C6DU26_9BACT|nr:hypothetical protein Poly41_26510 [Novipirellula artificiosorum]
MGTTKPESKGLRYFPACAHRFGLRPPYSTYTVKGFVPSDVEANDKLPTSMEVDYVRIWERVK